MVGGEPTPVKLEEVAERATATAEGRSSEAAMEGFRLEGRVLLWLALAAGGLVRWEGVRNVA